MIKNLGKFKQWTGERFGGAKVTMQTDDFQKLEQETEHKREGYDCIVEAVDLIESHLLKKKPSPEDSRNKVMPFEALGSCLYHYGTVFPEDSALGIALINLGQTETRIANLQEVLARDIKEGYKATLMNGIQEYKEYDTLRKKLASRRLDYDFKLNRLNKAKKEKPELEQEMQAARIKYQETEHDLIQKMAYLQEFENEHRDALYVLVEAQCNYHNQAKELFETIKNNWGQGSFADPSAMMDHIIARTNSIGSYHSVSQNDITLHHRLSNHYQRTPESSTDDYSTTTASTTAASNNYSSDSLHHQHHSIPIHSPPSHSVQPHLTPKKSFTKEFEKCRKALFDFNGQNNDEISFKTGDIITVIDEIDKGWWLGEVHLKKGIFPVNYTEEYDPQKHPLPPLPPPNLENATERPAIEQHHSLHSTLNNESYNSLPTINDPPLDTSPVITTTNTRRPPPPPASISSPVIPNSNNIGVSRTKSTAIRPPPPPPAAGRMNSLDSTTSRTSSSTSTNKRESLPPPSSQSIAHDRMVDEPISYINSAASSLHSKEDAHSYRPSSPVPPPPSSRANNIIESSTRSISPSPPQHHHPMAPTALSEETANSNHPPPADNHIQAEDIECHECDCREYVPNLFKKGYCNNCFHKHVQ